MILIILIPVVAIFALFGVGIYKAFKMANTANKKFRVWLNN
jgi:hypothetical protein